MATLLDRSRLWQRRAIEQGTLHSKLWWSLTTQTSSTKKKEIGAFLSPATKLWSCVPCWWTPTASCTTGTKASQSVRLLWYTEIPHLNLLGKKLCLEVWLDHNLDLQTSPPRLSHKRNDTEGKCNVLRCSIPLHTECLNVTKERLITQKAGCNTSKVLRLIHTKQFLLTGSFYRDKS